MESSPSRRRDLRRRLLETGLGAVRGAQMGLHVLHAKMLRALAYDYRFKPRPDDIYIATFPKSGTTLMQMIVHQLRGDGSMDFPHINAVAPWLEMEALTDNFDFLEALPSPRAFKTHVLHEYLPPGSRAIYIVRDVRDVFVSFYRQQCRMLGHIVKPEVFARQFLSAPPHNGNWYGHLESWWPHRNDPGVLFLTYEEMIADLEGTVRRVAAFCGFPLDESQMPRILERCGIEFMKRHLAKFDPRLHQTVPDIGAFIYKGKAGTWRGELRDADRETLEKMAQKLARKLGGGEADPLAYLTRGEPARQASG